MKVFAFFVLFWFEQLHAQLLPYTVKPKSLKEDTFMKIKILDTKEVHFKKKNHVPFNELSGLAYKGKKLFAVGDKGLLYTMQLQIKANKITKVKLLDAQRLKDTEGKRLKKKYRDSEGLAFVKGQLAISFEGKHRVDLYTLDAVKLKSVMIHKDLKNKKAYQGKNKGLESVAYNEKYGFVTAPERPLKNEPMHTIYAQHKTWKFQAKGAITGLEFRSKNKLLVLLRDFNYFTRERIITLVELDLRKSSQNIKQIAQFDSSQGWKIDNFEGITKIKKNRFLMVSDDNDSVFQKTLFVLFEIMD